MIPSRAAVLDAVRGALARQDGQGARFAAPLVTALVADAAGPMAELAPVIAGVSDALAAAGVPRGRQFVLFVHADGTRPALDVRAWRETLGVPVLVHDPAGATFRVRHAPEPALELDDELREAEAIVTVGAASGRDGKLAGGPLLLCPGAAGERTANEWRRLRESEGFARALALSLEVERAAPVDLAVTWDDRGRVTAAPGSTCFEALAREAGWRG